MTAYKYQALRPERSLEATVICPEELQVDGGKVRLDDALKGRFMQLLRLELSLGPVPQVVQLADGLEGSGGREEGKMPTQRFTLPLPDDARVLGFRYWEVGGSGPITASQYPDSREDLETRTTYLRPRATKDSFQERPIKGSTS